jgi:hypothetical protein
MVIALGNYRPGAPGLFRRWFDALFCSLWNAKLCYNFTRALNILGFDRFTAYCAEKLQAAYKRGFVFLLPPCARFRCCQDDYSLKLCYRSYCSHSEPSQPHNQNSCPASSGKSLNCPGKWPETFIAQCKPSEFVVDSELYVKREGVWLSYHSSIGGTYV